MSQIMGLPADDLLKPAGYNSPIDEIFLTQSDPMKVIPPKDGEVICNNLGTAFMSAKTANELLSMQHTQCCSEKCKVFLDGSYRRGQMDTVEKVLEIVGAEAEKLKSDEHINFNERNFYAGYIMGIMIKVKAIREQQGGEYGKDA